MFVPQIPRDAEPVRAGRDDDERMVGAYSDERLPGIVPPHGLEGFLGVLAGALVAFFSIPPLKEQSDYRRGLRYACGTECPRDLFEWQWRPRVPWRHTVLEHAPGCYRDIVAVPEPVADGHMQRPAQFPRRYLHGPFCRCRARLQVFGYRDAVERPVRDAEEVSCEGFHKVISVLLQREVHSYITLLMRHVK